jgi:hypothetical protein
MSQKEWAEFIAAEINDCPVKPSFRVRWDNHRQEFYEK